MPIDKKTLEEIRTHLHDNEIEIVHSETAECCFCRHKYSARSITEWLSEDGSVTAICPECGMDAVLGDASGFSFEKADLKEVNKALYGEDFMKEHPEAVDTYCTRYIEGKITHNKANEALFIRYLGLLVEQGDSVAAFQLGLIYAGGTEFVEPDIPTALHYFGSDLLRTDAAAITHIGYMCLQGGFGKGDHGKEAFENFARAAALGDGMADLFLSDCYLNGYGVNPDPFVARSILMNKYPEAYTRFYISSGKDVGIFPDLCLRLGRFYENGVTGPADNYEALRYYLLAKLGFERLSDDDPDGRFLYNGLEDTKAAIERLSKIENLTEGDPIFDNDTWSDSAEPSGEYALSTFRGKTTLSDCDYDSKEMLFCFTTNASRFPFLIVDVNSLYCGFVPGKIRWFFDSVSKAKVSNINQYDRVSGSIDNALEFIQNNGSGDEVVLQLEFTYPEEPENDKKGKA